MIKKRISLLLILCLAVTGAISQVIDTQFRPFVTSIATIEHAATQDDGKIVLAGDFVAFDREPVGRLIRLNADGTLDNSFMPGDILPRDADVLDLIVDSKGRILVAGLRLRGDVALFRLNPDGSFDASFIPQTEMRMIARVTPHGDGYLVLGSALENIIKIHEDGSRDNSFAGAVSGWSSGAADIVTLPDERILVAGTFTQYNGSDHNRIVCVHPDGSVDESFSIGTGPGGTNPRITSLHVQADGKVIVAGSFNGFNGTSAVNIVRLHPDGSVDDSFVIPGPAANVFPGQIDAMMVNEEGIHLAGIRLNEIGNEFEYAVIRLMTDGALDYNFPELVTGVSSRAELLPPRLLATGDGILLVGGLSGIEGSERRAIARIDSESNGIDLEFDPPLAGMAEIRKVKLEETGSILIGGGFDFVDGVPQRNFARLNPDGSVDPAFAGNIGAGPDNWVTSIEIDDSGRILLGGEFQNFDGTPAKHIVRLNSDGAIDNSFTVAVGSSYGIGVNAIELLPDGRILIGGQFSKINAESRNAVALLGADGALDNNFAASELNETMMVNSLERMEDGSLVVGGRYWPGQEGGILFRLDADGKTLDNFSGTDFSKFNVRDIAVMADRRFVVAGGYTMYAPDISNPLFQFDTEGALVDNLSVAAYGGDVFDVAAISGGYMLLGGNFVQINGIEAGGLSAIKLNGHMPSSFHFDVNGEVIALNESFTGSEVFLVSGRFREISGMQAYSLAKVYLNVPAAPVDLTAVVDDLKGKILLSWNEVSYNEDGFQILRGIGDKFVVVDSVGANVTSYVDSSAEPLQNYTYRVRAFTNVELSDFSNDVDVSTEEWVPPLPPEGLAFHISDDYRTVLLSWTDASLNETGFSVERAVGDEEFHEISTVRADYTMFVDEFAFDSRYRYRVRSYNIFGMSAPSVPVELPLVLGTLKEEIPVSVYPNPAIDVVVVDQGYPSPVAIAVYSAQGVLYHRGDYEDALVALEVRQLPRGLYFLRIRLADRVKVIKLRKE